MQGDEEQAEAGLAAGAAAAMPPEALARYRGFMRREAPAIQREWLPVDNYKARIEPLDPSMAGLLHELTVSVFWPHRAHDLKLMLRFGTGYIALDEIGRPLSSTMCFRHGEDFAMFGMMATTPRLQAQGAGGRLLRRVMADCAGRDLRLSATRSGYRLYESAGFTPVGLIRQHQGVARAIHPPAPLPGLTLRPAGRGDRAAVRALDEAAYGAPRADLLDRLLDLSETVMALRGDDATGFAMMRPFGKGRVIGPVVAEDAETAIRLAAHFIDRNAGRFLRLDTPIESEPFAAFLAAAGLGVSDTVTEMRLGRMRRALSGPQSWGLASHSLG